MPKFAKGKNLKNYNFVSSKISPGNLIIILFQLTEIKGPRYSSFRDILITKFYLDPLKGA